MKTIIHSGTVYDHTLSVLRQSKSNNPIVNIGCMVHDCGKAVTEDKNDEGEPTYHGHESAAIPIIDQIADRLKFSNDERDAIIFSTQYHMLGHKLKNLKKSRVVALRQNPNWHVLKDVIHADEFGSKSKEGAHDKSKDYQHNMDYVEDLFKTFGQKKEFESKMSKLINGQKIITFFPKIHGTDIGKIKTAVRDFIVQKDFNVDQTEIDKLIQQLGKELGY